MIIVSATIFLTSFLLFLVQPMAARLLLPQFGGSPSVWLTCMVFFQIMLLAGYGYAHALSSVTAARQKLAHCLLFILASFLCAWPPLPAPGPWPGTPPAVTLLVTLFRAMAVPFAAAAATGPLLQRWLSLSRLTGRQRPYVLYAVSNLGSLLGLLCYPFVIEPRLRLTHQSKLAAALFVAAAAGTVLSALKTNTYRSDIEIPDQLDVSPTPTVPDRIWWIMLSFIPASLLQGVTNAITLDIVAIPLVWVIPLGLYLLSFIAAFLPNTRWLRFLAPRFSIILLLPLLIWMSSNSAATGLVWLPLPLHLTVFFLIALACHAELAARQPSPSHLTVYYLLIATGGCLGGMFNALLAPLIFDRLAEYPLVLAGAALLMSSLVFDPKPRPGAVDLLIPLLSGGMIFLFYSIILPRLTIPQTWIPLILIGIPGLVCILSIRKPIGFTLGIAVLMLTGFFYQDYRGLVIHRSRSFFGVYKISRENHALPIHTLAHGITVHGNQCFLPDYIDEPLAYYHPTSPVGLAYAAFARNDTQAAVAVIGLGAGAMAAYAEPGRRMDFFEIDPEIERIARDTSCFLYLARARGSIRVIIGDARLSLMNTAATYGLIVIDAFSSDAIPMHLLTREAMAIYLNRLAPGGLIALHISNRHLKLTPIIRDFADEFGLGCWLGEHTVTPEIKNRGGYPSTWIVAGRDNALFPGSDGGEILWARLRGRSGLPLWTDDYSPILPIFQWQ